MLLNPEYTCQSIISKGMQVTDTEGLRIKTVTATGLSKVVSYNYRLGGDKENHYKALEDHASELGWLEDNDHAIGYTKDGYVLALIPKQRD